MNAHSLSLMLGALLTNVVTDLTAAGLAAPTRQLVTPGPPVRECQQVAVWWGPIMPGQGARTVPLPQFVQTIPKHVTHIVQFSVELVLCPPSNQRAQVPSAAEITTAGTLGADYGWTLYRSFAKRWVAGTMFAPWMTRAGTKGVPPTVPAAFVDGGRVVVGASFPYNVEDVA